MKNMLENFSVYDSIWYNFLWKQIAYNSGITFYSVKISFYFTKTILLQYLGLNSGPCVY